MRPPVAPDRIGRIITGALLLVGLTACASSGESDSATPASDAVASATRPAVLAPADFAEYLGRNRDVPIVNVHVPYEGHIEGTDAFVDFEAIATWKGLPDELDAPIVLYCRSGNMSGQAATDLISLGYTNIVDLDGGMNAWTTAGFELLDDPAAATE